MSRKALPKAITRPLEDIKAITETTAKSEPHRQHNPALAKTRTLSEGTTTRPGKVQGDQSETAPAPIDHASVTSASAATSTTAAAASIADPPTAWPAAPTMADSKPHSSDNAEVATTIDENQNIAKRREQARKIVGRYKYYAAAGGLLPVPVVNVAGITAINMRMVKALSEFYRVPLDREWARSTILAFIGGVAPTGLGVATASTLALVTPIAGLFGIAISSASAAALTRGLGSIFIERFETAANNPA
jgi:uncharacterized protein (DUF697 family)